MGKFFSTRVYVVPGAPRPFYHLRDAIGWCADNNSAVSKSNIEKYDSMAEYEYYIYLQELEKNGEITGLQRQVEFEVIPRCTELKPNGSKVVTTWRVGDCVFNKRKEAIEWCRKQNIPHKVVVKWQELKPMFRKIKIEERAVYTADFVYYDKLCKRHVVDVKSSYTAKEKDYILRRKLMLWRHKIKIEEIIYDKKTGTQESEVK